MTDDLYKDQGGVLIPFMSSKRGGANTGDNACDQFDLSRNLTHVLQCVMAGHRVLLLIEPPIQEFLTQSGQQPLNQNSQGQFTQIFQIGGGKSGLWYSTKEQTVSYQGLTYSQGGFSQLALCAFVLQYGTPKSQKQVRQILPLVTTHSEEAFTTLFSVDSLMKVGFIDPSYAVASEYPELQGFTFADRLSFTGSGNLRIKCETPEQAAMVAKVLSGWGADVLVNIRKKAKQQAGQEEGKKKEGPQVFWGNKEDELTVSILANRAYEFLSHIGYQPLQIAQFYAGELSRVFKKEVEFKPGGTITVTVGEEELYSYSSQDLVEKQQGNNSLIAVLMRGSDSEKQNNSKEKHPRLYSLFPGKIQPEGHIGTVISITKALTATQSEQQDSSVRLTFSHHPPQ